MKRPFSFAFLAASIGIVGALRLLAPNSLVRQPAAEEASGEVTDPSPSIDLPLPVHDEEDSEPSDPSRPDLTAPELATPNLAATLNAPSGTAAQDVETLHSLLRQYLRRLRQRQGLPIGDDIDLARALNGHNPMKIALLPPHHPAVTADGHLRDRWGTPYFIHPSGNGAFDIRSAGPDRKLFSADDVQEGMP